MSGSRKGQIAAGSRHQYGAATDLNEGPIRDYIRAHAETFGLATLGKKPDGSVRDVHVQLNDAAYFGAEGKKAPYLNTTLGKGSVSSPAGDQ